MNFLSVGGRDWEQLALAPDLVHMGHNCNHLDIHPSIHEAMKAVIDTDGYRNYTPPFGFEELRQLIGEDVGVADMSVMVTQGATEAIYQAMSMILDVGDETIVSDPGWPHIGNFAHMLRSKVVKVPIYSSNTGYKLHPDLLREYLTDRTKLITVIDPLNPLGSSYSETEIRALCALAAEKGAWLLHDATYRDFARDGHFPAIKYYDRAVMNVSLSKICGFAGLRIGACIARPEVLKRIEQFQVGRLGGSWIAQKGAIAAYRSKPEWRDKLVTINRTNQELLQSCIDSVPGLRTVVPASSGNFVAVDVTNSGLDAEQVVRAALKSGFVLRAGDYTSERFGSQFVRITTSIPTQEVRRFCDVFPASIATARAS